MEKKEGGPFGEWSLVPMNFLWWILLKIPCAEGSLARSTTGGVVSSMGLKNIALKGSLARSATGGAVSSMGLKNIALRDLQQDPPRGRKRFIRPLQCRVYRVES